MKRLLTLLLACAIGLPAEKQEELLDAWQKQWDDFIKEEAKTNG